VKVFALQVVFYFYVKWNPYAVEQHARQQVVFMEKNQIRKTLVSKETGHKNILGSLKDEVCNCSFIYYKAL